MRKNGNQPKDKSVFGFKFIAKISFPFSLQLQRQTNPKVWRVKCQRILSLKLLHWQIKKITVSLNLWHRKITVENRQIQLAWGKKTIGIRPLSAYCCSLLKQRTKNYCIWQSKLTKNVVLKLEKKLGEKEHVLSQTLFHKNGCRDENNRRKVQTQRQVCVAPLSLLPSW
jgi:hypothetical protein